MDKKSYVLSKKYTDETAREFGGLKGASCQIESAVHEDGKTTITFLWRNSSNEERRNQIEVLDGQDGTSPSLSVEAITGGHRLTFTMAETMEIFDVMDGTQGEPGLPGEDGQGVPIGGVAGQVLAKKSGTDYDTEWVDQGGGGGGTSNYNSLSNKPQIEGVELSGNKTAVDLGLVTASMLPVVPINISAFNNDVGYLVNDDIVGKQDKILASNLPIGGIVQTTVEGALEALSNKVNSYGTAVNKDSTTYVSPGNHQLPDADAVYKAISASTYGAFHPSGSKTCAELTSDLLVQANVGNVYKITDNGTTTEDWVGGAGQSIHANDMAVVVFGNQPNSFLFNLESGIHIDLSAYQTKILASILTIGGHQKTNVEDALGALNDVKADASAYIAKSDTVGLMKNDGTVDETQYVSDVSDKQNIILSSALPIGGASCTSVESALVATSDVLGRTATTFIGTQSAWDTKSSAEKAGYEVVMITDD